MTSDQSKVDILFICLTWGHDPWHLSTSTCVGAKSVWCSFGTDTDTIVGLGPHFVSLAEMETGKGMNFQPNYRIEIIYHLYLGCHSPKIKISKLSSSLIDCSRIPPLHLFTLFIEFVHASIICCCEQYNLLWLAKFDPTKIIGLLSKWLSTLKVNKSKIVRFQN